MKRKTIYKNTNDDWYGNYEGDRIKLSYLGELSDGTFRVCCWGNDDCGMEKDFIFEMEAMQVFKMLSEKDVIDKKDLEDIGFIRA